ncbi:hypothetical protein [Cupriavidus plantarum]|uniref:hypothetical protein n=1 Tax=Cupriavidus plantarum TaxID=942865 RepID=UPI001805C1F9|nr:hypothetical protein [Cupriavidus plantarum]NYI00579.1 hypothetical protein [Cupriavidus plantarum]
MRTAITRRTAIAAVLATAIAPTIAWSQTGAYPTRPVKVIVPFVPGGNAEAPRAFSRKPMASVWGSRSWSTIAAARAA